MGKVLSQLNVAPTGLHAVLTVPAHGVVALGSPAVNVFVQTPVVVPGGGVGVAAGGGVGVAAGGGVGFGVGFGVAVVPPETLKDANDEVLSPPEFVTVTVRA